SSSNTIIYFLQRTIVDQLTSEEFIADRQPVDDEQRLIAATQRIFTAYDDPGRGSYARRPIGNLDTSDFPGQVVDQVGGWNGRQFLGMEHGHGGSQTLLLPFYPERCDYDLLQRLGGIVQYDDRGDFSVDNYHIQRLVSDGRNSQSEFFCGRSEFKITGFIRDGIILASPFADRSEGHRFVVRIDDPGAVHVLCMRCRQKQLKNQ